MFTPNVFARNRRASFSQFGGHEAIQLIQCFIALFGCFNKILRLSTIPWSTEIPQILRAQDFVNFLLGIWTLVSLLIQVGLDNDMETKVRERLWSGDPANYFWAIKIRLQALCWTIIPVSSALGFKDLPVEGSHKPMLLSVACSLILSFFSCSWFHSEGNFIDFIHEWFQSHRKVGESEIFRIFLKNKVYFW